MVAKGTHGQTAVDLLRIQMRHLHFEETYVVAAVKLPRGWCLRECLSRLHKDQCARVSVTTVVASLVDCEEVHFLGVITQRWCSTQSSDSRPREFTRTLIVFAMMHHHHTAQSRLRQRLVLVGSFLLPTCNKEEGISLFDAHTQPTLVGWAHSATPAQGEQTEDGSIVQQEHKTMHTAGDASHLLNLLTLHLRTAQSEGSRLQRSVVPNARSSPL